MNNRSKRGIALLITLFFIISITAIIGIGLKQVNQASKEINKESFMIQTSVVLDDVMNLLKTSKEIDQIVKENSVDGLYMFLSSVGFIPFESAGLKVSIEITSARDKFNVNSLKDVNNTTINIDRVQALAQYVNRYEINTQYVNILLDVMGGIKEDMSYNSAIFNEKTDLFRDYIVSGEHLSEINHFYRKEYRENNLQNIDLENLFYFSKDILIKMDLNHIKAPTWEFILGCDPVRAEELALGGGSYLTEENLLLTPDEKLALGKFNVGYFEPYLDVKVEVLENDNSAKVRFEYDMIMKKGSNFVYEI